MKKVLCLLKKDQYVKLIIAFVVFIILLQGFHMILLMKLENEDKLRKKLFNIGLNEIGNVYDSHHSFFEQTQTNEMKVLLDKIVKQVKKPHILDSSGVYFIIPNAVSSQRNDSDNTNEVALCLHTTANHLYHLKDLSKAWDGPISVSVFTYGKDVPFAIYSIVYLHMCVEHVRDQVSFHLIFPVAQTPASLASVSKFNFNCSAVDYLKIDRGRDNYAISNMQYPNNILRNVAITNSKSEYVLVLDIDMVPSKYLHKQFIDFVKRQGTGKSASQSDRTVYVLPSFESQKDDFVPKTKQILLNDWKSREVRPFYSEICWKCQRVTDYEQWRNSRHLDFMDVAYYVDWEDPWEPFYIAKRTALPLYDGRFKQYGFNRISQVYFIPIETIQEKICV